MILGAHFVTPVLVSIRPTPITKTSSYTEVNNNALLLCFMSGCRSRVHETITTLLVPLYHVDNLYSPSTVAATCSDNLPAPTNGGITYAGGSTDNRPVGATAVYSCFGPYTLVGVSVRTCGSDGVWSGSAPVCLRKWNGLCTVCLLSVSSPIQLTALTYY